MQSTTPPLLTLSYTISPPVYEACVVMLGERIKERRLPRMVVVGGVLIASALGFLAYLQFYLHQNDTALSVLALLLFAVGVYNILYYPVLFERQLHRSAAARFQRSPYFRQPVLLNFYEDYIEENLASGQSRIQWTAVSAVYREDAFYLLRLSADNGLIIPREKLDKEDTHKLDRLLFRKVSH